MLKTINIENIRFKDSSLENDPNQIITIKYINIETRVDIPLIINNSVKARLHKLILFRFCAKIRTPYGAIPKDAINTKYVTKF